MLIIVTLVAVGVPGHLFADVSVDVIAGFNKMKDLTTDREIILHAMEKSTLLEVSCNRWSCPLSVSPFLVMHREAVSGSEMGSKSVSLNPFLRG